VTSRHTGFFQLIGQKRDFFLNNSANIADRNTKFSHNELRSQLYASVYFEEVTQYVFLFNSSNTITSETSPKYATSVQSSGQLFICVKSLLFHQIFFFLVDFLTLCSVRLKVNKWHCREKQLVNIYSINPEPRSVMVALI
jgi:hypothetical protein